VKLRILPVLTLFLVSLLPIACSKPSVGAVIIWDCYHLNEQPHVTQQEKVAAGNTITVYLCSESADFHWSETAQISDQTVVKQTKDDFTPIKKSGLRNFPAGDLWTFVALKKGTSTITLDYSQPSEGGEKAKWTYTLTVVVE
jgi:inhibitor of cysteine peptidase